MATEPWAIGVVILATIIGAFGPILLKKASQRKLSRFDSLIHNYPLFGGIALYGIGTVLFIIALRAGELSVLYPFVAMNYVWVSFLSIKFLGERMNMIKWFGIVFIIIGVSFIGLGS